MPYADPEKKREVDRKGKARARAEKKAAGAREGNPDVRARAWTFIVYPESAPEAHWHILLSFGGKKSYGQIWSISEAINGTRPQVCQDQKALIRYFSHRDNPEKAQYKASDIEARGGFDLEEYLKPTASECMAMQDEMVEWCLKYNVTEFHVLKIYAIRERPDWSAELSRSCFQITQYLKSRRHGGGVKACNPETGEVYE